MTDEELFNKLCPYYMSIGQSCEEYWYGNPWWSRHYVRANDIRTEQNNEMLWLQGLYVYDAFAVVLSNAFGKKGSQKQKYMEKPIRITPMTEEERKAEERRKTEQIVENLKKLKKQQP